jgi:ribosomal protein S18 acetylase RimI-like enzyme
VTPRAGGVVRRCRPQDLDRVAALWTALTLHHARLDPVFALRADADERIRALLKIQLRDPDTAIFVAEAASDLRGFCAVRVDRAPPILEETERAEITDLGVREDERRQGHGRALVEAALAWIRGRGIARVEVRVASGNQVGQEFWRALGFGDLMDVLQRRL